MKPLNTSVSRRITKLSMTLVAITLLSVVSITLVQRLTAERISIQYEKARLANLLELLPPEAAAWKLITRPIKAPAQFQSDAPITLYQAIDSEQVQAIVISFTTHDGYNGDIELLIGFDADQKMLGVRVIKHAETPGIGDAIDIKNDDWILQFTEQMISTLDEQDWQSRRNNGAFDHLTGATITSTAMLRAIARSVSYYQDQQLTLFERQGGPSIEEAL